MTLVTPPLWTSLIPFVYYGRIITSFYFLTSSFSLKRFSFKYDIKRGCKHLEITRTFRSIKPIFSSSRVLLDEKSKGHLRELKHFESFYLTKRIGEEIVGGTAFGGEWERKESPWLVRWGTDRPRKKENLTLTRWGCGKSLLFGFPFFFSFFLLFFICLNLPTVLFGVNRRNPWSGD